MKDNILVIDLEKGAGKGKREGLIQTVVTYVRNGKVITRKQWVRSEYAQHAKKNGEEKKEVMIRQAERERAKKQRELEEIQERDDRQGERERRKMEKRQLEYANANAGIDLDDMDEISKEYYKRAKKKRMEEEMEKRKIDEKRKPKERKDKRETRSKEISAFGQREASREANNRELDIR